MDTSPRLALPLIIASQAQKHITHNEALAQLETLVQPVVADMAANTPPTAPEPALCVVVGPAPGGAFAGKAGTIAAWINDAWHFHTPQAGWTVVRASDGRTFVFDGDGWTSPAGPLVQQNLEQVGINAAASSSNRLTVASDATLLTAQNNDHRLTINKAHAGATASLLFQSGWSGRAEMGLAGADGFSIKVSADGSSWHDALAIDPASGHVRMPARPLASAYLSGGSLAYPAGRLAGFNASTLLQGGISLGSTLASPASGAPLVVPAEGLYQVSLTLKATQLGVVSILKNETSSLASFDADLSSTNGRSVTFSCILWLSADDRLCLKFDEAATCLRASGQTFMEVVAL